MNKYSFVSFRFVLIFSILVPAFVFSQKLEKKQLDSLIAQAKRTHSDGLIILQDGNMVVEEYFENAVTPTYIASVSKALVSIAIIKLLSDGKIKSIDQPVADFYPEWRQGLKRSITLRMLLSHTSGMQNERNSRLEIETGPHGAGNDLVKLALAAEITDKPGTVFNYNNKATCLLPGIIEQASGKRMDRYFEEAFFKPMNISQFQWKKDGAGTPQGHGGFMLLPGDLAKFGQLMLNKGELNGFRFFEKRWADSAVIPSQRVNDEVGLLWNLYEKKEGTISFNEANFQKLKSAGLSDTFLFKLKPLLNKNFAGQMDVEKALEKQLGSNWKSIIQENTKALPNGPNDLFKISLTSGEMKGYYHTGSWGNYLVIVPGLKLVAVRLVKRDKEYIQETDMFANFVNTIFALEK